MRAVVATSLVLLFAAPALAQGNRNLSPEWESLFNGKDLAGWTEIGHEKWVVEDGAIYGEGITEEYGYLATDKTYRDFHLSLRFKCEASGNSGVYLMSTYEVQILDSYNNDTYPDGQAAAIYGRKPPMVNASKLPGEWQTYDIIFHRPIFEGEKVVREATFTVFHNGVLVHDNFATPGGTNWVDKHTVADYEPHPDKLPLMLQDHDNPVRFRNIWLVELED